MKEFKIKIERIRKYCESNGYDGMYLSRRANFSWLTCGGNSTVERCSEYGVADLLVLANQQYVLASEIERYRITEEELSKTEGFELITFPWGDNLKEVAVKNLIAGKRIASDNGLYGMEMRAADIGELRYCLTSEEESRARVFAQESAADLERIGRLIEPGMTEYEAASYLMSGVVAIGGDAPVVLVAFDERMRVYRHPTPTGKKLVTQALLARCSEKNGLIISVSRIISFGEPDAEFRRRYLACAQVNAAFTAATLPGTSGSEIFQKGVSAYAESGYPDEWKKHHQGGALGYATRDYVIDSKCSIKVCDNQMFSWNPSVMGTKIEDTIIIKGNQQELLTDTNMWPRFEVSIGSTIIRCPDILVR